MNWVPLTVNFSAFSQPQAFGKLKYQKLPYSSSTFLTSVAPPVLMADDDYEDSITQSQDGSIILGAEDRGDDFCHEDVSVCCLNTIHLYPQCSFIPGIHWTSNTIHLYPQCAFLPGIHWTSNTHLYPQCSFLPGIHWTSNTHLYPQCSFLPGIHWTSNTHL